MARVPYIDPKDLPEKYRGLMSSDANITRALSNSPAVAYYSGLVARYIRHESQLDPRLREMAILQVGYSTRNAYEYTHHIKISFSFGVSEADVRAIADESAGRTTALDTLAKAVLRAAREITENLALSDETFLALQKSLDNERLVELIFAISNYNGVVRMLSSLKIDLEDEYLAYLEKFPLPK